MEILRTKIETKRIERNAAIIDEYAYELEQNPSVKPGKIIRRLAAKFGITPQWARTILARDGVYQNKRLSHQEKVLRDANICKEYATLLNQYPDVRPWRIYNTIASRHKLSAEHVYNILLQQGAILTSKN